WIMYRQHFHTAFVNNHPDLTNNQISGLIAAAWHAQPQPVKDWWFNKAAEAKAEHMRKYPDYQYKP
ncbi:MAT1-2-1 protein, partial [Hyaloscypha hepaticicola]